MSSRKITDLHPEMQIMAEDFEKACANDAWLKAQGIQVLFTCTYRSNNEQAVLYAQGRTKPGKIVTNAKPGQSRHNATDNGRPAAQAFDVVPLRHGKPVWGTSGDGIDDNSADDATDDLEVWQRIAVIGESIGLEWAGRWIHFKEFPHFQMKGEA